MRRTLPVLAATLVTLLAGCSGVEEPGLQADPGQPPASAPAAATSGPGAAPSTPTTTDYSTSVSTHRPSRRSDLVVSAVRVGTHDGYDRVVLEMTGTGRPGWSVQYVDRPRADGSGEVIDVAGAAYLQVGATGVTYPAEGEPLGPSGHVTPAAGGVRDVYVVGTFEGVDQVLVGLDGKRPFRVSTLAGPPRLVVDISRR